jgi:hypothetical protein
VTPLRQDCGNPVSPPIGSTLNIPAAIQPARFLIMSRRKCISCGKPAIAYRAEADGSRTYLCLKHLPDGEAPLAGPKMEMMESLFPPEGDSS